MAGSVTRSNILNGKIKNERFVLNFTFQNVASGYTLRHFPTNITSAYVKSTIATVSLSQLKFKRDYNYYVNKGYV